MPRRRTRLRPRFDSRVDRLDGAFERVRNLDPGNELTGDLAKYLCVLVSGFLEKSVEEILIRHAERGSPGTVIRYIDRTISSGNLNVPRLLDLLEHFNADWKDALDRSLTEDEKEAINGIHGNRNRIAHGEDVGGMGFARVRDYYTAIKDVVQRIDTTANPQ